MTKIFFFHIVLSSILILSEAKEKKLLRGNTIVLNQDNKNMKNPFAAGENRALQLDIMSRKDSVGEYGHSYRNSHKHSKSIAIKMAIMVTTIIAKNILVTAVMAFILATAVIAYLQFFGYYRLFRWYHFYL